MTIENTNKRTLAMTALIDLAIEKHGKNYSPGQLLDIGQVNGIARNTLTVAKCKATREGRKWQEIIFQLDHKVKEINTSEKAVNSLDLVQVEKIICKAYKKFLDLNFDDFKSNCYVRIFELAEKENVHHRNYQADVFNNIGFSMVNDKNNSLSNDMSIDDLEKTYSFAPNSKVDFSSSKNPTNLLDKNGKVWFQKINGGKFYDETWFLQRLHVARASMKVDNIRELKRSQDQYKFPKKSEKVIEEPCIKTMAHSDYYLSKYSHLRK